MQRFGVKLSFIGSHKVISFTAVTCSPLKIKPIDRLIEPTDNLQRCFKLLTFPYSIYMLFSKKIVRVLKLVNGEH